MLSSGFSDKSEVALVSDRRRFVLTLAGAGLVGAGFSGCATKPVTSQVQLVVSAAADVNPDARGRPSPVSVRIYALKSATSFEAADFFSLYEKDTATLGQDIVRREELLLRPGDSKPIEMTLPPEAKVLAVLAAFRDLEHARWRSLRLIDVGKSTSVRIKLGARQVTVE